MTWYLFDKCKIMVSKSSPISTRRLCIEILKIRKEELLALVADAESYYSPYVQRKIKNGKPKERPIEPSNDYLKSVQKRINKTILEPAIAVLPFEIMGGRKTFSVVKNARHHSSSRAMMKYDVKSFFPSISYRHVYHIYRYRLNYCEEAANILAKLTTYPSSETDAHVPQGAPTSTGLAILAIEQTCLRIKGITDDAGLKFSIWVDDITISGDYKTLAHNRPRINHAVKQCPFTIHPDKDTGIIKRGSAEGFSVTGVTIDGLGRLTLGRKHLSYLRKKAKFVSGFSDKTAGKMLFLRQVNKRQGAKLYHMYRQRLKDGVKKRTEHNNKHES